MFPNLRLMLSASLAIIVLVAIVGSSLVLFRPLPARMVDVPEIVRPVVLIADDGRPALRFDTGARRNNELQRLLTLPSGPARAFAAEPPATFPYEVTAAASAGSADVAATSTDAPPAIGAIAIVAPPPLPSPATEPASIEAVPVTTVAALPEPARPPEAAAVAVAEPAEPLATGSNRASDTADVATPTTPLETVPVSSIPAVDDAPIPRPKPQLALADPKSATEQGHDQQIKALQPHRIKAKARPRRPAQARRIKRALPPPTAFESQQGQFPFFDNGAVRDAAVDSGQGNWSGHAEPAADRANAGRPRWRGYAIQPPASR
jgi:hypothetical protein